MDAATLHHRTVESWQARVERIDASQWDSETPCPGWSVRDLVNHVVAEELWTVPLLEGATVDEVGSRFDGDVLGHDPMTTSRTAAAAARQVVDALAPRAGTVHLSYGEESAEEYVRQLCADHLVHGWDLAAATDGDLRLDPELVAEVADWFAGREELYRSVGAIGPRVVATDEVDDAQVRLLVAFGRSPADPRWDPRLAGPAAVPPGRPRL